MSRRPLTRFFKFFLALAIAVPAVHADEPVISGPMKQVNEFVASLQGSDQLFLLTDPELTKLLAANDIDLIVKAQVDKVGEVAGGPDESLNKYDWSEKRAKEVR